MMLPKMLTSTGHMASKLSIVMPEATNTKTGPCPPPQIDVPMLGKYGSIYSSKPKKLVKPKLKKSFGKEEEPILIHLPPLVYPPKHEGYYNTMWDPRVRRGKSLVRFLDLETHQLCNSRRKNEKPKAKLGKQESEDNPLFNGSGKSKITFHYVQPPHKKELLDYSIFLEEQIEEDSSTYLDTDTQTEYTENLLGQVDPFQTHSSESQPKIKSEAVTSGQNTKHDSTEVKNTWRTGIEVGTQGDMFDITAATDPSKLNPRQRTIDRVSKIMASQLMYQAVQESIQCAELDHIRGQCEEITQWIAQDKLRKFEEHQALCRTLNNEKLEAEFEAAEEVKMKEAEAQVGVNLFAQNYIRTLFDRGFVEFEREGLVGSKVPDQMQNNSEDDTSEAVGISKAEGSSKHGASKAWLDSNLDIYFRNMKLDRSLVDDLIIDASKKRYEDHKAFFERPDVSSSLHVERPSIAKHSMESSGSDGQEEDQGDKDVNDDDDYDYQFDDDDSGDTVDDLDSGDKVEDPFGSDENADDGPEVIKLMENNPQFNYKEDDQDYP